MNVPKNFKYSLVLSLALISVLCISTMAQADIYYVAGNGNDSNPGTEAAPWREINHADSVVSSGDIVWVKDGTYSYVGVDTSGVTYQAHPSCTSKPQVYKFYFNYGASRVVIDGFEISTGDSTGCVLFDNNNDDNVVRNCYIHDCGMGVDAANSGDYNTIEYNVFRNCYYAFHTSSGNNIANVFKNNQVFDSRDDALNISPTSTGTQVLNNIIANSNDDGIHCFDGGQAVVKGNLVYGSKGVAFWVNGAGGIVSENNTVIGKSGAKWGTFIWIEKGNHIFRNNILYVDASDITMLSGGGGGDIDYNCWYNPQNPMTPIGSHSISEDPNFVALATNNFRLQASSPCIDAGDPGTDPALDLDGRHRPQDGDEDGNAIVDMGAYEYPGTDSTPPSAITDLAASEPTQSSIKLTWTAPGDDGDIGRATSYDIRYSTSNITESNWSYASPVTGEPAPQVVGTSESYTVNGLSSDTKYYFAIKASDEIPNESDLSNVASETTLSSPIPDSTPPSAITDLAASEPTQSSIKLTWTAPGDDGDIGRATSYDIRYSVSYITESNWSYASPVTGEPAPQVVGTSESYTVNGLSSDTKYYFAIKASDEIPNVSDLSNIASETTLSPAADSDGDGGGNGCFIAKAAYGTPMAEEVKVLCEFRDKYLLASPLGRASVRFYCQHSPVVADFIRTKKSLRAIVRACLKPIIWLAKKIMNYW